MVVRHTYGELAAALATLGFLESTGETDLGIPYRAFDNAEYDAWIVLPRKSDEESLDQAHLDTAERTVEGRGVASKDAFRKLLARTTRPAAQVA